LGRSDHPTAAGIEPVARPIRVDCVTANMREHHADTTPPAHRRRSHGYPDRPPRHLRRAQLASRAQGRLSMKRSFAVYRAVGHKFVAGFLEPEVLSVLSTLDSAQRGRGMSGAVAEIGVHRGQLFIGLQLLQRVGERSVAVDVFGDQELNVDKSGNGDIDKFLRNVQVWSSPDGLVIHQGDSTRLHGSDLRDLAGANIRLFSVDGGHTEQIVMSDMKLAEETLADGGIVIADDVFNQQWPGVAVGTLRYLDEGANLAPFFIGFNKVFFTQPEHCAYYSAILDSTFGGRMRVAVASSVFAGHEVGLLVRQSPAHLLSQNATARAVYHAANRELARAMQFAFDRGRPGSDGSDVAGNQLVST
jgi:methyltransferase family protein